MSDAPVDDDDVHSLLQQAGTPSPKPAHEPKGEHPNGWLTSVFEEAIDRAESDLMAVSHGPDGGVRTDAMNDLRNWIAKLQEAVCESQRNDRNMPCAYPAASERQPGCLRAERLEAETSPDSRQ